MWTRLASAAVLVGLLPTISHATPPFPVAVTRSGDDHSGWYCGLYCVFQAARMAGREIDLDQLVRPERVSGRFGSSASDLLECLREFGVGHTFAPTASYTDVCLLGTPTILLVKSSPEAPAATHWVLVLSATRSSAEVYDPSAGVMRMSAGELQSVWGGPAILLHGSDEGAAVQAGRAVTRAVVFCGLAGLALWLVRGFARRGRAAVGLVAASVALSVAWHAGDPAGFAWNGRTVRIMNEVRHPRPVENLSPADYAAAPSAFAVIDVRSPSQFEDGHLPGAINLPIMASYWRNRVRLAAVPEDAQVVLYCNSAECSWAATMAKSSLFSRYRAVRVLEEGIAGFQVTGGKLVTGPGADDGRAK